MVIRGVGDGGGNVRKECGDKGGRGGRDMVVRGASDVGIKVRKDSWLLTIL